MHLLHWRPPKNFNARRLHIAAGVGSSGELFRNQHQRESWYGGLEIPSTQNDKLTWLGWCASPPGVAFHNVMAEIRVNWLRL